ncbi:ABC transporter permease [Olsenella profusa]|uniref:ABC transporter permease n=1 Tax=Olsenella profusa TaxID=138595 RepID=A0ABS2F2W9_9ACTN|nr:ABC transporter permease [Olsenella profusa]
MDAVRSVFSLMRFDLLQALRNRGVVIWVLLFPLLLATVFMFMFDGVPAGGTQAAAVGVVSDGSEGTEALAGALEELSSGDDAPINAVRYPDEAAAAEAARSGEVCAYVVAAAGAAPRMEVPARESGTVDQAVVQLVLERSLQVSATLATVAEVAPEALSSPGAAVRLASALAGDDATTERLSVLRTESSEFARYYYAMLGFSSLMGAQVALLLVVSKRADGTPAGARRQLGAVGPVAQLASSLLAAWVVVFACLVVALLYMRLVVGVSFGGREGLAVAACAACALVSCAVGALIGSLPRVSTSAKDVVCTVATMGLSLPAGLFGEPSQRLADWLSANAPLVQAANPAVQVGETFYRLAYYDSLAPFAQSVGALLAISAVLLAVSALFMRRQRYAAL